MLCVYDRAFVIRFAFKQTETSGTYSRGILELKNVKVKESCVACVNMLVTRMNFENMIIPFKGHS